MNEQQLLKKRKWTGAETGKALIFDLINSYKQLVNGADNSKVLFGAERIRRMIDNFRKDRDELIAYNSYAQLQSWISQYQAVANANLQRYNHCYSKLASIHDAAESAEDQYRYIERLPFIMTQKQYDELKAKRIEEMLSAPTTETIFTLIIRTMLYYGHELEAKPKKANPLKAIKKEYMDQPIKGERLLEVCKGLEEAPEPGTMQASFQKVLDASEHFTGALKIPATKWELVEYCVKGDTSTLTGNMTATARIFPAVYGVSWNGNKAATHEEKLEQMTAFNDELPELVRAILKALDETKFTPGGTAEESSKPFVFSAVPLEQWDTTRFTWRELYEGDFLGFREIIESDYAIFGDNPRALINGISIIHPSNFMQNGRNVSMIDSDGNYKEPDASAFYAKQYGLYAYLPDNEESGDNIEEATTFRETLIESLHILLAYDKAVELIADEIGIPDFNLFNAMSADCLKKTAKLNDLYAELYAHIAEIDYLDQSMKAAKLQAIEDVFPPFDMASFDIPEERIKEAAGMIKELEAFKYGKGDEFFATLQKGGGDE